MERTNQKTGKKPGRWLYGVAILLPLCGIAFFIFLLTHSIKNLGSNFIRVKVPGQSVIHLKEAGKYTIFHEYRSVVGNEIYLMPKAVSGLTCNIYTNDQKTIIPVKPVFFSMSYSYSSYAGVAILSFRVKKTGQYKLICSYPEDKNEGTTILAISKGFTRKLLSIIFSGIVILFTSIGAGIFIILFTLVKRSREKTQLK